MGFLDRMVSDLVKSATGYNVRPLVRKVGAKRLLALGGAAVAGAALTDRMRQQQAPAVAPPHPGPIPRSAPPPPPGPLPSMPPPIAKPAVVTPPPPPSQVSPSAAGEVADEAAGDDDLSPETTLAGVRTVIAAALADGVLADAERRVIDQHLDHPALSPEQAAQARADLDAPLPPAALAALVDDVAASEVLYRLAAAVMLADDSVSAEERAWLDTFAAALGFDAPSKAAIEASIVFGR